MRIYLPESTAGVGDTPRPARATDLGGNERVLVVEDDEAVRRLACRILRKHGYRVEESSSPQEAKAVFDRLPAPPDSVLTDVVMPGTNGRELYETLRARAPALRVLYMSGYSGDVISYHGVLESGVGLIEKPFTAKELLVRVRRALDRQPRAAESSSDAPSETAARAALSPATRCAR